MVRKKDRSWRWLGDVLNVLVGATVLIGVMVAIVYSTVVTLRPLWVFFWFLFRCVGGFLLAFLVTLLPLYALPSLVPFPFIYVWITRKDPSVSSWKRFVAMPVLCWTIALCTVRLSGLMVSLFDWIVDPCA